MKNPLQAHRLANRIRRIPKRIHALLTFVRAAQARIDRIEDQEDLAEATKKSLIKGIRDDVGPAHAAVRRLQDRGLELGINPHLLNV